MTLPTSLDERFRAAAAAEGLLDAGYDVYDSPVGPLFVAATPRGVCRISYDADVDRQEARLAETYGLRVLRAPRAVDEAKRELDDYFEGRRTQFDLALDLERVAPFHREVLAKLARVPFGQTTTYGTLAAEAGRPAAARAVGTVMNRNPIPIVLPCHRVVGANGSLTGYAGGLHVKEALLRLEGAIL
jgi:methylated-DNA-[protein]-cysteine S-methyltransferase